MLAPKKMWLLFALCLFVANNHAQVKKEIAEDKYRAILLTSEEGLGRERWHTAIIKDKSGFLWVGSNYGELSRFDGNSFQQYEPGNNPGSIQGNNCQSFVEDSLHNIWIGLHRGLSRYDLKADTFTNFNALSDIPGKKSKTIPFWATYNKVYSLESDRWITETDIHSFARRKLIDLSPLISAGKLNPVVALAYSIIDSASNSLWMLPAEREGLVEISLFTGYTTFYTRSSYIKDRPDQHHDAEAMTFDRRRNCIWINSHDGLTQFTLNDKQFHPVDAMQSIVNGKDYDRFVGIDIDRQGRIWFATLPNGIFIYDPDSKTLTEPFTDNKLQAAVATGNLKIYCDRDGIVWASYWSVKGIYELIPYSKCVTRYPCCSIGPDSLPYAGLIAAGPDGSLWIGTQRMGMSVYNSKSNSFKLLTEDSLPGLKGKSIVPMVVDTINNLAWLNAGPPDRVYEMDIRTGHCNNVIFKDSAGRVITPRNIINFLSLSIENRTLFLDAGYGLFEITPHTYEARLVIPITRRITNLKTVGDGRLFICTSHDETNLTYKHANGKWIKITSPLDSLNWLDFYYDNEDATYWVGISNEIIHFDWNFTRIRTYTSEEKLINFPLTILADAQGNIWYNDGRKNICTLNTKTGAISTLSVQDGYQKQSFDWSSPRGKIAGGKMYFVGNVFADNIGLDRIDPAKYISSDKSTVYIKSLKVNQKPVNLPLNINITEKLSLRHFENSLSIETGIINHFAKGKSRMRYKLDNLDSAWQYAPYYYTIRYEGLPPGNYTLQLQASNASNEFNGPIKTLSIVISPAVWNTLWFRTMTVILLALAFYGIVRWRLQQKFRLQLERSEKEIQIAEIKRKAADLEMQALRAQMNPHFIFNSLNSINRFILQNNRAQASEYLTKFSKLVRMILQNSQAGLISLESELESLRLYLEMEALRFNYHFGYKISVPNDLDVDVMKVPPLIIQPYAENAIWHGLMHKEEKGQLDIELAHEGGSLYVKITDNGIGRRQAAALASKSATTHKSMGLQITANRIAMMQSRKGSKSTVTINDLVNGDGTAAGTEVIIKIPAIYD